MSITAITLLFLLCASSASAANAANATCSALCKSCDSVGNCLVCKTEGWGPQCEFACSLGCDRNRVDSNGNVCNKTSGICFACTQPSWGSEYCEKACPSACDKTRLNSGNICDRKTGGCAGCTSQWGTYCENYCSQDCLKQVNGSACNQTSGACISCPVTNWGPLCQFSCKQGYSCDRTSGNSSGCLTNRWGDHCQNYCPSGCPDSCDVISGNCTSCLVGRWGNVCEQLCPNGCSTSCSRTSGKCLSCPANNTWGDYCYACPSGCPTACDRLSGNCTTCAANKWGSTCQNSCPAGCPNSCNRSSGKCLSCPSNNTWGDYCNTCPSGCSNKCDRVSGDCLTCPDHFWGKECNHICPTGCSTPNCDRSSGLCTSCLTPSVPSCDFYKSCLETKYNCGEDGYPMSYGFMYCSTFMNPTYYNAVTFEGKKYINSTVVCLQRSAVATTSASPLMSCDELETTAFDSQPKCYVDSGICSILKDWYQLLNIVKGAFDGETFWTTANQTVLTMRECTWRYGVDAKDTFVQLSVRFQGILSTPQDDNKLLKLIYGAVPIAIDRVFIMTIDSLNLISTLNILIIPGNLSNIPAWKSSFYVASLVEDFLLSTSDVPDVTFLEAFQCTDLTQTCAPNPPVDDDSTTTPTPTSPASSSLSVPIIICIALSSAAGAVLLCVFLMCYMRPRYQKIENRE